MQMQNKPSEEKINQWSEFISSYLYEHDLMAFRSLLQESPNQFAIANNKKIQKEHCEQMLSNLNNNNHNAFYLTDIEEIKNININILKAIRTHLIIKL